MDTLKVNRFLRLLRKKIIAGTMWWTFDDGVYVISDTDSSHGSHYTYSVILECDRKRKVTLRFRDIIAVPYLPRENDFVIKQEPWNQLILQQLHALAVNPPSAVKQSFIKRYKSLIPKPKRKP